MRPNNWSKIEKVSTAHFFLSLYSFACLFIHSFIQLVMWIEASE